MEDQNRRVEEQANGASHNDNGADPDENGASAEPTKVGQVKHDLARVTRPLPATPPVVARPPDARVARSAARERIAALILALGDTTHPLHHQAVDELIALGEPAVPALNEALNPSRPWLTAYRAAEALGQIGDGRAAGALLEALHHPNSNVRWSAVRALAVVGDARALLDLRRVARSDRGKTSWGESVAGAAQSALNQMQSQNMLLRGADLIKTAVACVLMLVALILAWKVVGDLRTELRQVGRVPVEAGVVMPFVPAAQPTVGLPEPESQAQPEPTAEATPEPTSAPTTVVTGTVVATGNVRALPLRGQGKVIGGVSEGDEIIFLAATAERQWYRVKLGPRHAAASKINSDTGTGWVNQSLLSKPQAPVDVENIELPTAEPEPSSTPEPTATP
jgi:hypothetical protein